MLKFGFLAYQCSRLFSNLTIWSFRIKTHKIGVFQGVNSFQCSSLLDESRKEEFMDDIEDLYEDIREDHYESLIDRKFLQLEQARSKALNIDWRAFQPTKPSFLGSKVFLNYDLDDLVPLIDWKYFFDVWQLRGRYPNGRYPKIFNDETVGKLFFWGRNEKSYLPLTLSHREFLKIISL